MPWTNEIISECLTLYEKETIIWNPKHEEHKDRNLIHDAWIRIQQQLSINCSLTELKKKKDTLMGTFRKCHAKVKGSMKTGSGAEDVFKPEWFAYEQMARFLNSTYNPRKTKSSEVIIIY
ncbi:uncharacterized protein [Onthophagus taurus]|uniref:uncharacterized protein n=1 Tax=Onthophagus taurus TaxID=166361 RepID=UPI0039BE6983